METVKKNSLLLAGCLLLSVLVFVYTRYLPDSVFEQLRSLEITYSERSERLSVSIFQYKKNKGKNHPQLIRIVAELDSLNQTVGKLDELLNQNFSEKMRFFVPLVREFAETEDSSRQEVLLSQLFSEKAAPRLISAELHRSLSEKAAEHSRQGTILHLLAVGIFGTFLFIVWAWKNRENSHKPKEAIPELQSNRAGSVFWFNKEMKSLLYKNFNIYLSENQYIDTIFKTVFSEKKDKEKIFSAEGGDSRLYFYPKGEKAYLVTAETGLEFPVPPVRSPHFEAIINQNIGLFELGPAGHFLSVNSFFSEKTGFSEEELLRNSWSFLHTEDSRAGDFPLLSEIARAKNPVYEHQIRLAGGGSLWVRSIFSVIQDDKDSLPKRFVGMMSDISSQKENEQLFLEGRGKMAEGLSELSQTNEDINRSFRLSRTIFDLITSPIKDYNILVSKALKIGLELTELEVGILSRIEGEEYTVIHFEAPQGTSLEVGQKFELKNTYCEITCRENRPVGIHQMSDSEYRDHPCFKYYELEAYIGVPVLINGKIFGTMNFSSAKARPPFSHSETDRLLILAQWIGSLLEKELFQNQLLAAAKQTEEDNKILKKANTRLRISQKQIEKNAEEIERQKEALDQLAMVILCNAQGLIVRVNSYFHRLTGYSEQEVIGKHFRDLFPKKAAKSDFNIRKSGEALGAVMYSKSGEKLFLNFNTVRLKNKRGEFTESVYMGSDLTDIHRAEENLLAANRRQTALFEAVPDHIYLLDKTGVAQKENGRELPEGVHKFLSAYFKGPESLKMTAHLLAEEPTETVPVLLRRSRFFYELRYVRLHTDNVLVFVRDVSRAENQKIKTRRAEERLLLTAASAGIGIWEWVRKKNRLEAEEVMRRLFGFETKQKLSYRHFLAKIRPSDRTDLLEKFREMKAGQSIETDFRLIGSPETYLSIYARLVCDPKGNTVRLIGTCRNITEQAMLWKELKETNTELTTATEELQSTNEQQKTTSERLEQAYEKLKNTQSKLVQAEKMSAVGQLTAGIAHEINNAMNLVGGSMQVIRGDFDDLSEVWQELSAKIRLDGQLDTESFEQLNRRFDVDLLYSEVDEMLKTMTEGAMRAQNIVGELRNFSRKDEGEYKSVDLNKSIEATIKLLSKNPNRQLQIQFSPDPHLPKVECQPGKINQVFLNLIINAEHAVNNQGVLKISSLWLPETESAVFRFEDQGPGIPEAVRGKIFEPFFTTKPVGEGTGLGLSIAYEIIREHRGEIRFETETGKGTVFIVSLPARHLRG